MVKIMGGWVKMMSFARRVLWVRQMDMHAETTGLCSYSVVRNNNTNSFT